MTGLGVSASSLGNRPIRVMHVTHWLSLAGMEYGVIKLVNRLDPERFYPMICCLAHQRDVTKTVLDSRIPVFELKKHLGRDWRMIFRLAALLRHERVDIVHSHNWQTFFYSVVAAALAGSLVIHGEHGRESQAVPRRRLIVSRWLARRVSRLVAVSGALSRELVEQWNVGPERVCAIPNGVDFDAFGHEADVDAVRREFGFGPDTRVILNVGGLRPVKDHPTLLRAFVQVLRSFPEARLLLAGSDFGKGLQPELEALAEDLGIRSAVFFPGIRHDVPRLLSLCEVYVNTSVFEGMSNTILEAMASRKPVVATAVGGNPELVSDGKTGYLIPPGDDRQLAERLVRLLGDPALAKTMGVAGRAMVERDHPMARMIQAYSDLYEEAIWTDRLQAKPASRERIKKWIGRGLRWSGLNRLKETIGPHRLTILTYHRVLPMKEIERYPFRAMAMRRDLFEAQIAHLARGYTVLALPDAVRLLHAGRLPRRAVAITFDDGYRDNYTHAWPILTKYEVPATFFVVTGALDRNVRLWWDDVEGRLERLRERTPSDAGELPGWLGPIYRDLRAGRDLRVITQEVVRFLNDLPQEERLQALGVLRACGNGEAPEDVERMMTWEHVREMSGSGMLFGAHTVTHAFLDELDDEGTRQEIEGSVARLQERLGTPVALFSYPRGRVGEHVRKLLAESGIEAAVTTEVGFNSQGADPFRLKRLDAGYLRTNGGFDPSVFDVELQGWFNGLR